MSQDYEVPKMGSIETVPWPQWDMYQLAVESLRGGVPTAA